MMMQDLGAHEALNLDGYTHPLMIMDVLLNARRRRISTRGDKVPAIAVLVDQ
ncbi:MAG: hypothetical protein R3C26_25450 [Calditrichia bacterium]